MRKVSASKNNIEYLPTAKLKMGFMKFCQKLGNYMDGSSDSGVNASSPDLNDIVDAYDIHWLQKLLEYQSYDRKGYFINNNSHGFVFECSPIVGIRKNTVASLSSLFQGILPVDSNLQFMLVADHRVGDVLQHWRNGVATDKELLQKLADHRLEHYKKNILKNHNRIFK